MPRHYGKYPPHLSKRVRWYREIDKKRGFANDLTIEAFMENIHDKPCAHCGATGDVGADRIDNTKGHTVANCRPSCTPCNNRTGFAYATERKRQRRAQAGLQYDGAQASLQYG